MPPVTETQPLPSEASPTSVLLVEDDRATAALTKALVQESGTYVVECEADLASALRRITSTAYDCVLLDVHLPDAHGADAVRRIRRIAPGLPILLLSGMESGALQRLAIQSGAQVSLPKDHLDRDLLQSGIRTAMDREAVEATHGYNRRLAELLEIAGGIQHIGDRITRVLDVVRANLGMDLGIVARIEGSRYVVEHVASTDDDPTVGTEFELGSTFCSLTAAADDVVAIDHTAVSSHSGHPCYRDRGLESYIGAPLVVGGARHGTVNFSSAQPSAQRFQRHDFDYVRRVADLIGGWVHEYLQDVQLGETRERFRLAFDNAPIGMVTADLEGTMTQVNPAFASAMDTPVEDLLGSSVLDVTHPDDVAAGRELMRGLLSEEGTNTLEKRYVRPDGRSWWGQVHVSVLRNADGVPQSFVTQILDTTERRATQRRLADMALHDSLTGLPNRALLQDRLAQDLATGQREGTTTAVLFLDLDRFKHVNDTHGHAAGDQLLKVLAGRLDQVVRPHDTVARLGGDEFVVVCTDMTDHADLDVVISRISEAIEQRVMLDGAAVTVGVSIGVAFADPGTSATAESLLRDADAAMYRAKGRGRARAEVFTQALRDDVARHDAITRELHDAIMSASLTGEPSTDGLRVVYQPLLATADDRPCGVETLVRWQHPTLGFLSPDEFLSAAEETGLIIPMGRWVLSRALRDWAGSDLPISVNHAVAEIAAPDFVEFVQQQLEVTGVPPDRLCIEVTESSVLEDHGSAMAALRRLRGLGVRLAIDDFGAGYTSLAHLTDSPFTELKIDRSFITNAGEAQWSIVEAIVRVCDTLGLHSVIEGVEDLDSLERARSIGCDASQGYVHSRPVPLAQARTIVLA